MNCLSSIEGNSHFQNRRWEKSDPNLPVVRNTSLYTSFWAANSCPSLKRILIKMVNQSIKDEWRGAWHSIKWRWWEKVSNQGSTVASNIVPEGHCRQVYSILSDPGYNIGFCVVAKDKIVVLDNSISWTSMCWMHKATRCAHWHGMTVLTEEKFCSLILYGNIRMSL